jgi:hypothetical protein
VSALGRLEEDARAQVACTLGGLVDPDHASFEPAAQVECLAGTVSDSTCSRSQPYTRE